MCGRLTQHYTWQQIHEFLSVIGAPQNLINLLSASYGPRVLCAC